ncbi:MAG: protein kinase [Proteobacteria bacterium]|nr:protein kinase [Pseudomonadota bacterium]
MSSAATAVAGADPPRSLRANSSAIADLAFADLLGPNGSIDGTLSRLSEAALVLDLSDPEQRRLGDYELIELIGEGGMGVVYRARQLSLDREVAVKLLAAGPWASREFVQRFVNEARNAARMQHPNIVAIYEVGAAEELHFFSMRLIRGESLAAVIKRDGKLAPQRAATLLRTIAEAVDYAHRLGVLHLDLKPANVLLDENGDPHVADFGLAQKLEPGLAADNHEVSGTPSYMAPEQATAGVQKITPATDVWGLGAIGYELATGQPPFLADSAQDTLKLVVGSALLSPRELEPTLPRDLAAIIEKCMARDAAMRYASARELADDLGRFLEHRPVQARPLGAPQRVWRWAQRQPYIAVFGTLFLLALIGGLIGVSVQWRRANTNADLARKTLWDSRTDTAQKQIEQGDAYPALADAVANLREMQAHGDHHDAALERLRIGTVLANAPQLIDVIPRILPKGDTADAIAISPDAKTIALSDSRMVYLVDVASGKELWKADTTDKSFGMMSIHNDTLGELRFSTDGHRLIAYTFAFYPGGAWSTMRPHVIDSVLIDVAAGKVVEPPREFADFLATSYSDDGRYALLFDKHGGMQRWRSLPWTPDGDKVVIAGNIDNAVTAGPLLGEALLTPDGATVILAGDANLTFRALDAEHLRPLRALKLDSTRGRATAWALRHDGRQIAIGTVTGQIVLWDPQSGEADWLRAQLPGRIAVLRFSANDSRLLAASNDPSELRVFDPRTETPIAEPVRLSASDARELEYGIDAWFGKNANTLLTRHIYGKATLWQLPEPGFPPQAPVVAAPVMAANNAQFALATDARSRLLATFDNGQIKLWRLRPPPLNDRVAAPMVSDELRFDGRFLVSVDGNRASVFDVATNQTIGKTIALPEAPTFAGLDGSSERLIAFAGREISCWNWRSGKPCWPVIALPDSPLRLSLAANAPVLAVSSGSNDAGKFFEQVRIIDLATGALLGNALTLPGPLGTLRLSGDGKRLLAWQDKQSENAQANLLYVIDAANATILQRLPHVGKSAKQIVYDARLMPDGSIWSRSNQTWNSTAGGDPWLWHWDADGKLLAKIPEGFDWAGLLALPGTDNIISMEDPDMISVSGVRTRLIAPASNERVEAGAVSADGKLLALATFNGVALTDIAHNERLLPNLRLPLPFHEMVQQLAFAQDGSRLVGRTTGGRWFQWPLVADNRPADEIAQDIGLRDLSLRTDAPSALSNAARKKLRAADPGPAPEQSETTAVDAGVAIPKPVADARYEPLDLDSIANVDPRLPMNHATRLPPQPQNLPSLPRGLQRYDGVDFLLGRAVQLSGKPQNLLDAAFPPVSPALALGARRVRAIDTLVMQYIAATGVVGSVLLRYADGGERTLDIASPRDVLAQWTDATDDPGPRRVGWLGSFAEQMHINGGAANAEETFTRSYIVRMTNPEPERPVTSITLEAPPNASPGLLFLALTLETQSAAASRASSDSTRDSAE